MFGQNILKDLLLRIIHRFSCVNLNNLTNDHRMLRHQLPIHQFRYLCFLAILTPKKFAWILISISSEKIKTFGQCTSGHLSSIYKAGIKICIFFSWPNLLVRYHGLYNPKSSETLLFYSRAFAKGVSHGLTNPSRHSPLYTEGTMETLVKEGGYWAFCIYLPAKYSVWHPSPDKSCEISASEFEFARWVCRPKSNSHFDFHFSRPACLAWPRVHNMHQFIRSWAFFFFFLDISPNFMQLFFYMNTIFQMYKKKLLYN